jgi:hypothetical protein
MSSLLLSVGYTDSPVELAVCARLSFDMARFWGLFGGDGCVLVMSLGFDSTDQVPTRNYGHRTGRCWLRVMVIVYF